MVPHHTNTNLYRPCCQSLEIYLFFHQNCQNPPITMLVGGFWQFGTKIIKVPWELQHIMGQMASLRIRLSKGCSSKNYPSRNLSHLPGTLSRPVISFFFRSNYGSGEGESLEANIRIMKTALWAWIFLWAASPRMVALRFPKKFWEMHSKNK